MTQQPTNVIPTMADPLLPSSAADTLQPMSPSTLKGGSAVRMSDETKPAWGNSFMALQKCGYSERRDQNLRESYH